MVAVAVVVAVRNGTNFSQCRVVWGGFSWAKCGNNVSGRILESCSLGFLLPYPSHHLGPPEINFKYEIKIEVDNKYDNILKYYQRI
jgi:hypothetical protein